MSRNFVKTVKVPRLNASNHVDMAVYARVDDIICPNQAPLGIDQVQCCTLL